MLHMIITMTERGRALMLCAGWCGLFWMLFAWVVTGSMLVSVIVFLVTFAASFKAVGVITGRRN